MTIDLKGQVALVTGGSRGIGKAVCLKLASLGADIIVNYTSSEESAQEVKKACEALGVKAEIYKANVADFHESKALIDFALETFGKLTILVNNAGITKDNVLMRMSEEDFDRVIDINLKGTFNCMKHVCRPMMKQKSGTIINMSSVVGLSGNVAQVNYAASKAGIVGMSKSMAKEVASRGIRVNVVAPGFIATEMTDVLDEKIKEALLTQIPMNSLGEVEDVSNTVAFLASDLSSYMTGQVISVDGGMHM